MFTRLKNFLIWTITKSNFCIGINQLLGLHADKTIKILKHFTKLEFKIFSQNWRGWNN